jgi:hypothetical protein
VKVTKYFDFPTPAEATWLYNPLIHSPVNLSLNKFIRANLKSLRGHVFELLENRLADLLEFFKFRELKCDLLVPLFFLDIFNK